MSPRRFGVPRNLSKPPATEQGRLLAVLWSSARAGAAPGSSVLAAALGTSDCGGLPLAGCRVPTKAAPLLPSSVGQGREARWKAEGQGKARAIAQQFPSWGTRAQLGGNELSANHIRVG